MTSGMMMTIGCLFFGLLLLITVFSKERINTYENIIFKIIIVVSFVGLLLHIGCFLTMTYAGVNSFINFLVTRLYLIYLIAWMALFTLYVMVICCQKKVTEEIFQKYINRILVISIVFICLALFLKLDFYMDNKYIYSYGPSVNCVYIYSVLCILIWSLYLLRNIKSVRQKKYTPIFAFMLLGFVAMMIQKKYPGLQLITSLETFICYLMYFTIENPDIKLMEELEYSKRVAEKSKSETINTLNNIKNELDEPLNQIVNFNDKKIITSTKEELIKEVKNLRIFTTSFADRVFSLIELGKVNSGDYMLNEEMYNTYGMINELEKMLKISNDKVRYNFDVSDDINKVLYGDKNKIKQLLLYINDYILERTKSKTMNIKVSNLSVGNLCRLKFSYFIDLSFEKYLIKDKKEIYIKEEKDDFDYRVILSMLRLLEGKINIKKENIISITITIDQKIKSEYDVNNYISSQDNYVNNQIKYTGKKIIIFNDSFEENQKIIELLKKYNLEISLCDNIEKLNKLITENNYDLVLVDDMFSENKVIPREEMLKQCSTKIIQRVNGTRIPVVIMVTKNNKSLEKKYLKYGYVDYIIKPLMDKDVSVILKKYLK